MYPAIIPDYRLEGTVSNPKEPVEVIGFEGRNKKAGRVALVMKQNAVKNIHGRPYLVIPLEAADRIEKNDGEIAILDEEHDEVRVIGWDDFDREASLATYEGNGEREPMYEIPMANDHFAAFRRSKVNISN